MRETEKTGKVWVMNPRILIIAGLLLLCLVPAGVQAASAGAQSTIAAQIGTYLTVSIDGAYSGIWTLNQGANSQDYGDLNITTNAPWSLDTTTPPTYGDYLKSGTTNLTYKLQLNGGDVTTFDHTGTFSQIYDLLFTQQVTMTDLYGDYGTTVTFTVTTA